MARSVRIQDGDPIVPSSSETAEAGRIVDFMTRQELVTPKLVGANGEQMELPVAVYRILRTVVEQMSQGNAVAILPVHHELTTTQAAEALNVSRPFLVKLLDEEEIPFHYVGTHRRIRLDDLLAYKHRRDGARRETLRSLTRESQDMGLDF